MTGKGDPPYRAAVNWVDFGTALHCAFGTLAALIGAASRARADRRGRAAGDRLSFTNATLIEQAVISANRVPTGNLARPRRPADIYPQRRLVLCQVTGPPAVHPLGQIDGEEITADRIRVSPTTSAWRQRTFISERMARGARADHAGRVDTSARQ